MKSLLKTLVIVLTAFFLSYNLSINASTISLIYDDTNPPNPPEIDGETYCKLRQEYVYNITITHPDGHRMTELFVMFGDGTNLTLKYQGSSCHKGWRSGLTLDVKHSWKKIDDFIIKAKVKDYFGEWSDWGTLNIDVSKIKLKTQLVNLFNILDLNDFYLLKKENIED